MDQQLRALVALTEDLDSVPSTYMVAHNQFHGTQICLLTLVGTHIYIYIYM